MAKEEIVREAYGEYIEYVAQYIDKNGWLNRKEHSAFIRNHFYLTNNLETKFVDKVEYWRPRSLYGIDDNNGWIMITIESELPNDLEHVWLIDEEFGTDIGFYSKQRNKWYCDTVEQFPTHYQPIQKPEPPKF